MYHEEDDAIFNFNQSTFSEISDFELMQENPYQQQQQSHWGAGYPAVSYQQQQAGAAGHQSYDAVGMARYTAGGDSGYPPQKPMVEAPHTRGNNVANKGVPPPSRHVSSQPPPFYPTTQQAQQQRAAPISAPLVTKQPVSGASNSNQQPSAMSPPMASVGNRSPTASGNWGASLPASVIEKNDYREAAKFFLEAKGGNEAAAMDFLRGVFLAMTTPVLSNGEAISLENHDWDAAVRNGPPYLTPEDQAAAQAQLVMNQHNSILLQAQRLGLPPKPPLVVPLTLLGDEIDQRLATLVILVPGRAHIVGHLIGKGGAEVGRIEREMSVTIKIEAASKMNVQLVERSVCIIGTVGAATLAQQLVSHKVHEKLLSEGVQAEVLKMVVPNEIVRHLIGKNGANINRLQNESGARIQVEPESTMPPASVGRTIVLQGAERCRTFAQYLILRQIAEDRNVHSEWAGRLPHMHSASASMASPGSPTAGPISTGTTVVNHPPLLSGSAPGGAGGGAPAQQQQQQQFHPRPVQPGVVQQAGRLQHPPPGGAMTNKGPASGVQLEESTVTYTVPEQSVAYVIGRNGAVISEIQAQTGAKVQISRGGVNNAASDVRKVVITGPPASVEAAQYLIRQKLQAASAGANLSMRVGAQPPTHQHQHAQCGGGQRGGAAAVPE